MNNEREGTAYRQTNDVSRERGDGGEDEHRTQADSVRIARRTLEVRRELCDERRRVPDLADPLVCRSRASLSVSFVCTSRKIVMAYLLSVGGMDALVQLAREDGLEERGRDRDPADLADTTEELAEPGPDCHRVLCRTLRVSPWITHDAYNLLTRQMGKQRDCSEDGRVG